jgi:hypothetical protein
VPREHNSVTSARMAQGKQGRTRQNFVKRFFSVLVKPPEIAETTLAFYRNAAGKFLEFLGSAADSDLTEKTSSWRPK